MRALARLEMPYHGWGVGESSLLGAAAAPESAPSQKSKSLLPGTVRCGHAWEQERRFNVSRRQGARLAGSSVGFRRVGGYPDLGWYLLAERRAGQGGAQGGEAVSRHKLHPKEDDRSLPRAVVSR